MDESAALLLATVIPEAPVRQRVLTVPVGAKPYRPRLMLTRGPEVRSPRPRCGDPRTFDPPIPAENEKGLRLADATP